MTSSDVLDTCLSVQLVRASDILLADLDALLAALKKRAIEHKDTVTIGRSHGIHAEPTTFGVKLALAYAGIRALSRTDGARPREVATCAISGPSAPSPTSILMSKSMSPKARPEAGPSPRRSFRATAT
jgi:adenylosuccinate lyase